MYGIRVMAMVTVMDIMVILIATGPIMMMDITNMTGIAVIMVQGMDPVIGDKIKKQGGTTSTPLRLCACPVP